MLSRGSMQLGGILLVIEVDGEMVRCWYARRAEHPVAHVQHGDEMRGLEPLGGLLDLALTTHGKLRHLRSPVNMLVSLAGAAPAPHP